MASEAYRKYAYACAWIYDELSISITRENNCLHSTNE